jgi:hypothetical protein
MQTKSIFKEKLLLSYTLFIFLIISCYLSYSLNIWEDEIYSLKSTQGSINSTIRQALNFEGQPPIYFILLNLWRHIDNGIFFSRMFSVLSIVLATIVLFKLSKRYIPGFNPILLCILFLINPFIIWASVEIRLYALSVFLSLSLLFFFNNGFICKENEKLNKFFYYVFAFLSFYTFYYFSFFLLANGILLVIKKKYKEFGYYCFFMAIILIPALFILKTINNQINIHDQTLFGPLSFFIRSISVFKATQNYFLVMHLLPFNGFLKLLIKLFFLWVFLYGIIKMELNNKRKEIIENENTNSLIITICIIYLLYILTLNLFPLLYFADRYLVVVFPLLTILIIKLIYDLYLINWQKKTIIAILAAIMLIGDFGQYQPSVKKYDYKTVATFLEHNVTDSRPILFYAGFLSPIFKYYYKGQSKLFALPDSSCYRTNYFATIKNCNELDSIFGALGTSSLCLVSDEQINNKYSVDFNRKMIYNYIKAHSIIELDTNIYGRASHYYLRIVKFKLTGLKKQ